MGEYQVPWSYAVNGCPRHGHRTSSDDSLLCRCSEITAACEPSRIAAREAQLAEQTQRAERAEAERRHADAVARENLDRAYDDRDRLRAALESLAEPAEPADEERLDWLDRAIRDDRCQMHRDGRGWVWIGEYGAAHYPNESPSHAGLREAIDAALRAEALAASETEEK